MHALTPNTAWHCEYMGHTDARQRKTIQRWMRLLFNPKASPYWALTSFIQTDPIFQLDEDVFVFNPGRCLKAGFSKKFLLNFMVVVRLMREHGSVTMQVLRNMRTSNPYTILTVVLARHAFIHNPYNHDPFEYRTVDKLRNFVRLNPNMKVTQSNQVWGDNAGQTIFDTDLWRTQYRPKLVQTQRRWHNATKIDTPANTQLVYDYLREVLQ